jgi:hypothetical protein
MTRTRVLDWGSYLFWDKSIMFDWKTLHDKAGVECAIFKGNETNYAGSYSTVLNIEAARAILPVVGCYYWHDPSAAPSYLLDIYKKAIDREKPDFIMLDTEQAYDGYGNKIDPNRISDTGQALFEGLKAAYSQKKIGDYTRKDFVLSFSPPMLKWLPNTDGNWWAGGPDYGTNRYRLTYAQISANLSHRWIAPWTADSFDTVDLSTWEPSLPAGITTWKFWQYSSRILLPAGEPVEYDHQEDWSFFNGSLSDLQAWAGLAVTPPVPSPLTWEQSIDAWARTQGYTGPKPL